jgi:hypothetical protein
MEKQELETKVVDLERRVKELATSLSIDLEWQAELREMLSELLQVLKRREELSEFQGFSLARVEQSTAPNREDAIEGKIKKTVQQIFRDYEDQFKT